MYRMEARIKTFTRISFFTSFHI